MSQKNIQILQIPEPLNIYRLVLKGDHLHFGYWPHDVGFLSLEEAQQEMFNKISRLLPDPPGKLLDVGCGLGLSAALLASQGYEVTAIAPADSLISYAKSRNSHTGADFVVADFMDDEFYGSAKDVFDIIFLQESLQYLHPLDKAIKKMLSLLKPRGTLLIGDEVCLNPDIRGVTSVHMLRDIISGLGENNFKIMNCEAIGSNVKQTCHQVINRIQIYFEQLIKSLSTPDASRILSDLLNGWKNQKDWYETGKFSYILLCARKNSFVIRPCKNGEENEILALFNSVFMTNRSMSHWQWKFQNNPFGNMNVAIAKSEQGTLAAHFSAYPVEFYCNNSEGQKEFLSAQGGDTMTNPAFRGVGLGRTGLLSRTATYFYHKFCQDRYPFIYGFNTGKIKKLGERYLDYKYIYPVPYFSFDTEKALELKTSSLNLFKSVKMQREERAGRGFDIFFQNIRDDYVMLVKRDSRYLNWRYFECPDVIHELYSVKRFGKIVGWSVFSRRGEKLIWGDCLFSKDHLTYLKDLIRFVLENHSDVTKIEGWFSLNPVWWSNYLSYLGFQILEEPNNLFPCFKFFDQEYDLDFIEQNFYFTMGDSDLF